ncbi:MAG: hypothetical protein RLZZ86_408 [Cyanobacteriota bacterium]|jgi:hypothetical protein
MNILNKHGNYLNWVNFVTLIIILILSFFKQGSLKDVDGEMSYVSDKILSIEKMQAELLQKDTLIEQITKDNLKIQTYLLREYHNQTLKLNSQFQEFSDLKLKLKNLGVNINDLNQNFELSISKIDSSVTKLKKDTLKNNQQKLFSFQDTSKHLNIFGKINLDSETVDYTYKYKATYNILTYTEKNKKRLKEPLHYVTVTSDDPNAEIKLKSLQIKPNKPKFHIGMGLGASAFYNNNRINLRPSINVSFYKPMINVY